MRQLEPARLTITATFCGLKAWFDLRNGYGIDKVKNNRTKLITPFDPYLRH